MSVRSFTVLALILMAPMAGLAATPAPAYRALEQLPDWSGWWDLEPGNGPVSNANPPPMRPDDLARFQAALANPADDADPLRFCRPLEFVGYNNRFADAIEFLFTPGRVTITSEASRLRRIYTDGRPLPRDPVPTKTGTSLGRWEGSTLVVQTIGIDPNNHYPGWDPGSLPIGDKAVVNERIRLVDANTLVDEIEVIAPALLTRPDKRTITYRRVTRPAPVEVVNCVERDRAIDTTTGTQRLDLTPPADLPPPPPKR